MSRVGDQGSFSEEVTFDPRGILKDKPVQTSVFLALSETEVCGDNFNALYHFATKVPRH